MSETRKPPPWKAEVPPPEAIVIVEDGKYKAELINYVFKGDRVKDIRVRGPNRTTRKEATKDGYELYVASCIAGYDPALFAVRSRRKELESIKWKDKDLEGVKDDGEEARKREQEALRRENEQKQKEFREEMATKDSLNLLQANMKAALTKHKAVGPGWKKPGSLVQLPQMSDHPLEAWWIHEKQDSTGKYRPWLYFNGATGKYYRQKDSGVGYIQIGVPHAPQDYPMNTRAGSANLQSSAGKKLDMAVLLPELHKTGFLLKQALEFMDKPASLLVLCDGLRNAAAGAEFCARRFHTLLLPKLSERSTEFEDFELVDILRDAVEKLDGLLLDSQTCFAGCGFAVALQLGTRVALGSVGGVRCILCRPPPKLSTVGVSARVAASRAAVAATAGWSAKRISGGEEHSLACEDERLRVESAGNQVFEIGTGLSACSARPSQLAEMSSEKERLLFEISRAAGPFAALGLSIADLAGGAAKVRSIFRRRSLAVHPDKVDAALRQRAVTVFAKLESCASAVEAMLQADHKATEIVAQIDAALDSGKLVAEPSVAAKLLGVPEGSTSKVIKEVVKTKFHVPLGRIQEVVAARKDVERALKALEVAEETVLRGTQYWTPPEADEAVYVTRALGCKDLKTPVALLTSSLVAECVELEPGVTAVAMVADGAQSINDTQIAKVLSNHSPCRPRAAALRIALDAHAKSSGPSPSVGIIAAYFDYEATVSTSSDFPAAKRAKTAKPDRVRISHVLLRWAGLKGEDEFARPGLSPSVRSQADAERTLLELLEQLSAGDPKTLGARFKTEVMKQSECASALNVPYADLGWIDIGSAEPALEAAAFGIPVGSLSDVVVSTRGAHLMYRLG